MASELYNWYLVLELDYDPPVTDEGTIKSRIDEKRKFWSGKANDSSHKEYKIYLEKINQITSEMCDPEIRARYAKEACDIVYGDIDKILDQITKKEKEIAEDKIQKIASSKKINPDVVKRRAQVKKIKIVASKEADNEKLIKKYLTPPAGAESYKSWSNTLKMLEASNLYDFLYKGTTINKPQNLPSDKLLADAKKKAKEYVKNDRISTCGKDACKFCEKAFKDASSKQIYDSFLKNMAVVGILEELKAFKLAESQVSEESYSDTINKLIQNKVEPKEAEALLIAYCKKENIAIPITNKSSNANKFIKYCRCGERNDISDGRTICKECGLPLQIKCPQCGTLNDNSIRVCKCGFYFDNIDKAEAFCDLADDALRTMDFSSAEVLLSSAEGHWKGSERVAKIKAELSRQKSLVGSKADELKKACREKRFFEARAQFEKLKKIVPNYSEPSIEEEIANAIETAEQYKKKAQSLKNDAEIVEACTNAYEACHDCPGIKELLAKYPPAAPANLIVKADPSLKLNVLSWGKSSTSGLIYYNVVRKEGAIPISVQDGTLVGRVSMNSINDSNIKPGVQYFYVVYAERAGIYSSSLVYKDPVCNLFEISGLKASSGENLVQLSWDLVANNANVEIERTDSSGKKVKLNCTSRNSFVDSGLENEHEYRYRVYLTYTIGANKYSTAGVNISATPTRPPLPIEKLVVKPLDGNDFQIEWDNPEGGEVQFFYALKKPEWLCGDSVSVSELEKAMNRLVVNKISASKGKFTYDKEETIYITAAVVKSGTAVVGTMAHASKGSAVKIINASLANEHIAMKLEYPKNCDGFVVLYRHDRFCDDLSDKADFRKFYPLRQYLADCVLKIDAREKDNYYITIFAQFKLDGESDYSSGTEYLFANAPKQNIFYSISTSKKLFGSGTVTITFENNDSKKYAFPDVEIISEQGRPPMFRNKGRLFYEIPAQEVSDSFQVKIPLEKGLSKETYIKPFLKDESLSDKYIFKLKVGSENKIS